MLLSKTYGESDWSGGYTDPLALNPRGGPGKLIIGTSGTVDYELQETYSDIQGGDTPVWRNIGSATGPVTVTPSIVPRFIRIVMNSSTDGELQLDFVQSDV